MSSMLFL